MKRVYTIIIALIVLIVAALLYLFVAHKPATAPQNYSANQPQVASPSASTASFAGSDEALKNALNLYIAKKQAGVDFSMGPCLGKIADDWVADIAHNPRFPVDDLPQNQCEDFRTGRAHHFIELDESGNLIRSL